MRLLFEKGVWFDAAGLRVAVDPHSGRKKADVAIISHGHSDHVSVGHRQYLMTLPTYELLKAAGTNVSKTESTEFGKTHQVGSASVRFENSGHVLGSGQVLLEESTRTVITGDFKTEDSLLFKGAQPVSCDTLVMETTFGLPQFSFPPREEVYAQIGSWVDREVEKGHFVVLAGYALGKAQELTRIVNDYSYSVPLVHERVFDNNRVYEKFGVRLGKYLRAEHNMTDSDVLILPPSLCDKNFVPALEFALQKKVSSAVATGWNYSYGFDKSFCLSDHCDFEELLDFVAHVAPKQVYTMHGYAEEFAATVRRRLGIPARPLSGASQQTLSEFALQ
jgi:Cft2 family RNA processing exonuclease